MPPIECLINVDDSSLLFKYNFVTLLKLQRYPKIKVIHFTMEMYNQDHSGYNSIVRSRSFR